MMKNVGGIDKILRIVLGLAIIGAGVYFQHWLGVIGVVFLATGVINFCPMYSLIGFSSNKDSSNNKGS